MADDEEALTITEAADRAGVARSTIRRALDRDAFDNAYRDPDDPRGTWLIPVDDLDAAGYGADRGAQQAEEGADRGADGGVPQGAAMVPLDTFRELFQQVANAEARAAKAEAEAAFLRERLAAEEEPEEEQRRWVDLAAWATLALVAVGIALAVWVLIATA